MAMENINATTHPPLINGFNPMDKASIGRDIRRHRDERKVPRNMLCARLGIAEKTLVRWEAEGTTMENRERALDALHAMGSLLPDIKNDSIEVPLSMLRRAKSVDLAAELMRRARVMEEHTKKIEELREVLESNGLGRLMPPGM